MAWAGSTNAPGPFNFVAVVKTAECLRAMQTVRVRFPAAAPAIFECDLRFTIFQNRPRASLRDRVSKTQFARGSTEAACQFQCRMTIGECPSAEGTRQCRLPSFVIRHSSFGIIPGVVADKQCTCPASKLMWERYPPTPPSVAWNPNLSAVQATDGALRSLRRRAVKLSGSKLWMAGRECSTRTSSRA
jgi:hypothetical protein